MGLEALGAKALKVYRCLEVPVPEGFVPYEGKSEFLGLFRTEVEGLLGLGSALRRIQGSYQTAASAMVVVCFPTWVSLEIRHLLQSQSSAGSRSPVLSIIYLVGSDPESIPR